MESGRDTSTRRRNDLLLAIPVLFVVVMAGSRVLAGGASTLAKVSLALAILSLVLLLVDALKRPKHD